MRHISWLWANEKPQWFDEEKATVGWNPSICPAIIDFKMSDRRDKDKNRHIDAGKKGEISRSDGRADEDPICRPIINDQ